MRVLLQIKRWKEKNSHRRRTERRSPFLEFYKKEQPSVLEGIQVETAEVTKSYERAKKELIRRWRELGDKHRFVSVWNTFYIHSWLNLAQGSVILVNREGKKNHLMASVCRVIWILKFMRNCFIWDHQCIRNFAPPPPPKKKKKKVGNFTIVLCTKLPLAAICY